MSHTDHKISYNNIYYFMLDGASANNCGEPEQETIT